MPPLLTTVWRRALLAAVLPTARVHLDAIPSVDVVMRPEHLGAPEAVLEELRGLLIGPLGRHTEAATRIRRRTPAARPRWSPAMTSTSSATQGGIVSASW